MTEQKKAVIEIREQSYENVQDFKDEVIDSFAEARGHPFGYDQFAFEALDKGQTVGTINGYRLYDWLYVEFIVVTEKSRGARVGTQLLDRAEELARGMGLEGVALDTFRYQAPTFYTARGYVENMVIPGKTRERDRIYLLKRLGRD